MPPSTTNSATSTRGTRSRAEKKSQAIAVRSRVARAGPQRRTLLDPGWREPLFSPLDGAPYSGGVPALGHRGMGEGGLLDILIFAMVAGVIFLRLRGVLGRRTGHEKPPPDVASSRGGENGEDKVTPLPDRAPRAVPPAEEEDAAAAPDDGRATLARGIERLSAADRTFAPDSFVEGARVAYEMIVASFASGDTDTLRPLVADEVYANFAYAIDDRDKRGEVVETTILGIKSADIVEAGVNGSIAEGDRSSSSPRWSASPATPRGEVVAGDTREVQEVTDIWTFARSTKSSDPNWTLIETRSPN